MTAVGRWFITPHAVHRYIENIRPGLDYDHALGELIRHSDTAHFVRATVVDGICIERWRAPKPTQIRFIVSHGPGAKPQLVTVLPSHDRRRSPCRRRV
jgi:hypothetical protein